MRISDWSSDVCSSDLTEPRIQSLTVQGESNFSRNRYRDEQVPVGGCTRMQDPELLSGGNTDQADDFDEKRVQPRFALLLRRAKLVSSCGEFMCIVRHVSASG